MFNFLENLKKLYTGDNFERDISRFPIEIEDNKIIPAYILRGCDVEGLILRFFYALELIDIKFEDAEFYYKIKRDPFYIQFYSHFTGEKNHYTSEKIDYKQVSLRTPGLYDKENLIDLFIKMGGTRDFLVPEFMYVEDFFEVLSGIFLNFDRKPIYRNCKNKSESFYERIKYIPWLEIKSGIEINKNKGGTPLNNGSFFFNNIHTPYILQNAVAIVSKTISGKDIFDIFVPGEDKLQYILDLINDCYGITFIKENGVLKSKNIKVLQVSRGTQIENRLSKNSSYHIIIKTGSK